MQGTFQDVCPCSFQLTLLGHPTLSGGCAMADLIVCSLPALVRLRGAVRQLRFYLPRAPGALGPETRLPAEVSGREPCLLRVWPGKAERRALAVRSRLCFNAPTAAVTLAAWRRGTVLLLVLKACGSTPGSCSPVTERAGDSPACLVAVLPRLPGPLQLKPVGATSGLFVSRELSTL